MPFILFILLNLIETDANCFTFIDILIYQHWYCKMSKFLYFWKNWMKIFYRSSIVTKYRKITKIHRRVNFVILSRSAGWAWENSRAEVSFDPAPRWWYPVRSKFVRQLCARRVFCCRSANYKFCVRREISAPWDDELFAHYNIE